MTLSDRSFIDRTEPTAAERNYDEAAQTGLEVRVFSQQYSPADG